MSPSITVALVIIAAVLLEIVLPGQTIYHAGWYNVALTALVVLAIATARKGVHRAGSQRARIGVMVLAFGAAIAGGAAVASGLLAPDNQRLIGAPGERLRVEGLGVLVFPIAPSRPSESSTVMLERPLHAPVPIGEHSRDVGSFIVRSVPRSVAYVEARDLRGGRLTITQPSGSAFLSPVLLMEQRQSIAGIDLPFDSFAVPAARRVVKAVLFDPAQAAMVLHGSSGLGRPGILFAVDDANDRPLPHAIALSAGGKAVDVGGLSLVGEVASYPAVDVMAAPNLIAVAAGTLLVLAGLFTMLSAPFSSSLPRHDGADVSYHNASLGEINAFWRQHVERN